ncbi:hypothetical protein M407DRAFT_18287, partial [Tulasnella calospora MUT 4182]
MPMMLCVPRSVSPIDVRQAAAKGPPATPPRSKLFTRNKDTSAASSPPTNNLKPPQPPNAAATTAAGPSNVSASSFSAGSSTACSDGTTAVTEDGGIAHSPGPTTPVSMSKRTGSKWLASLRRSPSNSKQKPNARDVVAVAELATTPSLETGIISAAASSGTTTTSTPSPTSSLGRTRTLNKDQAKQLLAAGNVAGGDSSDTSNVNAIGNGSGGSGGKTLTSFLGSLTKRPKEPVEVALAATPKPSSRPTPSPLPLQPRNMSP